MKCVVEGELAYNTRNNSFRSIMKPSKLITGMCPREILRSNTTKMVKKQNVNTLLGKHYGDNWRDFDFLQHFKDMIDGTVDRPTTNEEDEDELICEQQEESPIFAI
ncbi:hypothetical protein LSTR_LSTR004533 [Laodelphax striatellus]|uniref:Uncharacterized protein n=1 Tax=Laodelphax striatellus TaxID=195883 RepID=A0A482WTB2_LAOST|nr:hypothetical protein LSTR_LSTR004533 [Laodelphax striatellus]